jgi:hypothetical protein
MQNSLSSPWNEEVIRLLLLAFKEMGEPEKGQTEDAVRPVLKLKLNRMRQAWKSANAKIKADGTEETEEEIQTRLLRQRMEMDQMKRRAAQRN